MIDVDRDALGCYGEGENAVDDMIEHVLNMSDERVTLEIAKDGSDPKLVLKGLRERLAGNTVSEACECKSGEIIEFPRPQNKGFRSHASAAVIPFAEKVNFPMKMFKIEEGIASERWAEEDRNYAGTIGRRLWRPSMLVEVARHDIFFYEKASSVAKAVRSAGTRISRVFEWRWKERNQQRSRR